MTVDHLQPLRSRILVRPIPFPDQAIHVPERFLDCDETPIEAEVVLLGLVNLDRRRREIPWTVQPGDRVIFQGVMGAETFIDSVRHLIVKEIDILAILGDGVQTQPVYRPAEVIDDRERNAILEKLNPAPRHAIPTH